MNKYDKLINIAKADIGYTESPKNSNKTKYGKWYGMDGQPWCMMAVQYWHNQINAKLPYKTASCSAFLNWYIRNKPEQVSKEPKKGYIVIYPWGHTGIVVKDNKNGTITAIEGNTSAGNSGSQSNGGGVYLRVDRKITPDTYFIDGIGEGGDFMTGEEIFEALNEYLKTQPLPEWAEAELREAIKMGITDGSNPMVLIPRYQAAIMAKRALKNE